ncbi:MAG: glycosyltransferase family 4 protein [Thermoleophilaceae bacterium]
MRVLSVGNIYPPHAPGGGYELTWRSANAHLRSRGHEVRVLASVHREPGVPPEAPEDPDVHRDLPWYWHDHVFPKRSLRERVALEREAADVLARHLAGFRPDAVCWWGMGGMSLGLIERARRAGLPAVGVVGDEWMVWGPRVDGWLRACRRLGPAAALAERFTGLPCGVRLGDAAGWLFNSEEVRRRSEAAAGPLQRASVEHPGIEESLFMPSEPRPWVWRLLYLGRMDERKGVHVALEALALLPHEATLTLQGRGDPAYVERLRVRAGELGLGERVFFSSESRERLPEVYAAADVVLFPVQWDEPWGLVPLEAMAVGRPVVASGTGGSAEYLRHEENSLLYSPRNSPEALAAAVRRLADSEPLRLRLREGGFPTAVAHGERRYNQAIESALVEASGAPDSSRHYPAAP